MGAGNADGSGWAGLGGGLRAARGQRQATVSLEGKESESGCGGGSGREVAANTALPTLQFCQGPWQMPACLQKPPSTRSAVSC